MLPTMDGSCPNKEDKPPLFEVWDKVLKRIFPIQEDVKGKFAPTW